MQSKLMERVVDEVLAVARVAGVVMRACATAIRDGGSDGNRDAMAERSLRLLRI